MYRCFMQYMTRNFILSLTAALPLFVTGACGDNGGGTEGASSSSTGGATSTTGDGTTTAPTSSTTEPATTEPATSSTTEPATSSTTEPATTTTTGDSTTDVTATTGEPDTSSGSTGDPLAECLMMVEPGDMCGECACKSCTAEYEDCQSDMGCAKIFKCVQDSGCSGQDCALPCGQTIQENGGVMGEPLAKAITLGMCIGNNCMAECEG